VAPDGGGVKQSGDGRSKGKKTNLKEGCEYSSLKGVALAREIRDKAGFGRSPSRSSVVAQRNRITEEGADQMIQTFHSW